MILFSLPFQIEAESQFQRQLGRFVLDNERLIGMLDEKEKKIKNIEEDYKKHFKNCGMKTVNTRVHLSMEFTFFVYTLK